MACCFHYDVLTVFNKFIQYLQILRAKANLINGMHVSVTGQPCGSVAQWSDCSHSMREDLV